MENRGKFFSRFFFILCGFFLLSLSEMKAAQVITVNSPFDLLPDANDLTGNNNGIDGDVGDLPGPDGKITFREALHAAYLSLGITENIVFSTNATSSIMQIRHGPMKPYRDDHGSIKGNGMIIKGEPWSSNHPGLRLNGLEVTGNHNTIEGFVFDQFPNIHNVAPGMFEGQAGLVLYGNRNVVKNCIFGLDALQRGPQPNAIGIVVKGHHNEIGPDNIISGNLWQGVSVLGNHNRVFGNHIGDTAAGLVFGNGRGGVLVRGDHNIIGAKTFFQWGPFAFGPFVFGPFVFTTGAPNEIVGNGTSSTPNGFYSAVSIEGGSYNIVVKNRIGVDPLGAVARGNIGPGIDIVQGGHHNRVIDNIISGNGSNGIWISNSRENIIENNRIGTDTTGQQPIPNTGNGIALQQRADTNRFMHNVVSGNVENGIKISNSRDNRFWGNKVGVNKEGNNDLSNGESGIVIRERSKENKIGLDGRLAGVFIPFFGRGQDQENVISSNTRSGIFIYGAGTDDNRIVKNHIGTERTGNSALGNGNTGVHIRSGAKNNVIRDNVISGNERQGVRIEGAGTNDNRLEKNRIGMNVLGNAPIPNRYEGVYILNGSSQNVVGSLTPNEGNIISSNTKSGIKIKRATHNEIHGNIVGLNKNANQPYPNRGSGIRIFDQSHETKIGTFLSVSQNTISGNDADGIYISDSNKVQILQAMIGLDKLGSDDFKNERDGIRVDGRSNETKIGVANVGNKISGNKENGIFLEGSDVRKTTITANIIGLDARGQNPKSNKVGIKILGAVGVQIGGPGRLGNTISGNKKNGVEIAGNAKTIKLQGNRLGLGPLGRAVRKNEESGVLVKGDSKDITIGGFARTEGNLIAGNKHWGLRIGGAGTHDIEVLGNMIGLTRRGEARGNEKDGILVEDGAYDIIIGSTSGQGNAIGSNTGAGIVVRDGGTRDVSIQRNYIGLNPRANPRPNAHGVSIENGARRVTVGGSRSQLENRIAYNTGNGVQVIGAGTQSNAIRKNSIYKNGAKGISLGGGANNGIGLPSLIIGTDLTTGRNYMLGHRLPAGNFEVDLFNNNALDATGFGEGEDYLEQAVPGANRRIRINDVTAAPYHINPAMKLTATITDVANRNTSEFAPVVRLTIDSTRTFHVQERVGDADLNHWVYPQNPLSGPLIRLDISPDPNTPEIRNQLGWSNATVHSTDPLRATVSSTAPAEHAVGITFNGNLVHEARVWVVWAATTAVPLTRTVYALQGFTPPPPGQNWAIVHSTSINSFGGTIGPGTAVESIWSFRATIHPPTLITSGDRPDFDLAPRTQTPAEIRTHPLQGGVVIAPLTKRWDFGRRFRLKIISPNVGRDNYQTDYSSAVSTQGGIILFNYPADRLFANDHSHARYIDNNPYDAHHPVGRLDDRDGPTFPMFLNQAGNNGDTIEFRGQFQEFVLLEINGMWYQVSDDLLWRHHVHLTKVNGAWTNSGNASDQTNNGW